MSAVSESIPISGNFPSLKAIFCILPDDGTDKRLLAELRSKKGIIRAGTGHRRGVGVLAAARTKRGKLPASELVKQLLVICAEDQADEIFELIFWSAGIDKPGGGTMWQKAVAGCTPYELPADVPDEESGG